MFPLHHLYASVLNDVDNCKTHRKVRHILSNVCISFSRFSLDVNLETELKSPLKSKRV